MSEFRQNLSLFALGFIFNKIPALIIVCITIFASIVLALAIVTGGTPAERAAQNRAALEEYSKIDLTNCKVVGLHNNSNADYIVKCGASNE